MMPFLTTFMLWGAMAAAIPIAIHLFFRSRYKTVPWAAMKFLLTSVEQTSRRLRFQEYLLLLIRIAVLVFLAIALARPINLSNFGAIYFIVGVLLLIVSVTWILAPFWKVSSTQVVNWGLFAVTQVGLIGLCVAAWFMFGFLGATTSGVKSRGQGDSVDAVLVFDTSFSMGAQDGAKTRLERAKEEAVKVIDELPAHSTVQIVTCAGKTPTLVGPRSPANIDQAKQLVQALEIAHLATDLAVGVAEAKRILALGTASNKELYVFSDMQKSGFDQQAGALKTTLTDIKEKAVVHFVRCGTRSIKNVAIIDITPQTKLPRPGETVGFGVRLENTSSEAIENLNVTLLVDGEPSGEQKVKKIAAKNSQVVTVRGAMKHAGPRVVTAKVSHDELDGDNRLDQVVLVRKQVNILVVDGNPHEKDREKYPEKAESYYLMHSLVPVPENERDKYQYNPRMIPARLAAPLSLNNQDICILLNCSLDTKLGVDGLPPTFVDALEPFVREGRGLVIFSGENVNPAAYNETFGKKLGLLPMPLKSVIKARDQKLAPKETELKPFFVDRRSFGGGPSAFWIFKDENRYAAFDKVEVWQHLGLDESASKEREAKKKVPHKQQQASPEKKDKDKTEEKDEQPANVLLRLNNAQPLMVSKKIDAGEVIFIATAAHDEGVDPKTGNTLWTDFPYRAVQFIPFMNVTVNYLLSAQTQTYNLTAGETLQWFPKEKHDNAYYLVHPDGKRVERLGIPDKDGKRFVVTASDLPRAGIYRMTSLPRGAESTEVVDPVEALKSGLPIAVIPDLSESADLSTLTKEQINAQLGFEPIHLVAGQPELAPTGADRLNREWTTWALLLVMLLVLGEVAFAWWCGKAW